MFLVVFVTLVISIISLFAQVLALQTSRINAAQVGLAQTMLTWNNAAVIVGKATPTANMNGIAGCALTGGMTAGNNGGLPPASACPTTIQLAQVSGTPPLPLSYSWNLGSGANFIFASVAFQAGVPAVSYVVTYIPPSSLSNGDLVLANGFEIGYSRQSLTRQMTRAVPNLLAFGSVTTLGILSVNNPIQSSYTIPTSIPVNSLALISLAQ